MNSAAFTPPCKVTRQGAAGEGFEPSLTDLEIGAANVAKYHGVLKTPANRPFFRLGDLSVLRPVSLNIASVGISVGIDFLLLDGHNVNRVSIYQIRGFCEHLRVPSLRSAGRSVQTRFLIPIPAVALGRCVWAPSAHGCGRLSCYPLRMQRSPQGGVRAPGCATCIPHISSLVKLQRRLNLRRFHTYQLGCPIQSFSTGQW